MATLYRSNGETIENIQPENGSRFTPEELRKLLGCETVEHVFIRGTDTVMAIDKDGKHHNRDINPKATRIYHSCDRMNIYDWVAGDALVYGTAQS